MQDFRNKVAVITGGASGIGAGLAERFAADGARGIVVADLNLAQAEDVAAAINADDRAGQFTHASRTSRASRNTSDSARARSINSPFSFCSRMRRSCAFSTSLAVFACR